MLFDRLLDVRQAGVLVLGALVAACSGGGNAQDSTADTTSGGVVTTSTGTGAGGSGTVSSSSGFVTSSTSVSSSTGTGAGGAPPTAGAPGSEVVSAGQLATSPSYRMVMTMGQPTQNQGLTTSPGYKLRGGLVPATQK